MLLFVSGCISPRRTGQGGSGGGGGGTGGQLYVSTANSILHFGDAETTNGNAAPVGTINGASTQLSSPQHLLMDTSANRLYVANQGGSSILVFDNVSALTGNIRPTRVISGSATHLASPVDVALDTTSNLLYVADGTSILVFASASTVNGNISPVRNINMGVSIGGLLLDAANNQLYVSDPADNVVDRLDSVSSQDVVGVAGGLISGPDTRLAQPRGLALDAAGRLIVSNAIAPVSITVYPSAGSNTGDVTPVANINGSNTRLQSPGQIALNRSVSNGELYVADGTAASILIFTNLSTTTGNVGPVRTIGGSKTSLSSNAINGLAIDPTR